MLANKMTTRCSILKTTVSRGNFGAIQTPRLMKMTTHNSDDSCKNIGTTENQKQPYDKENADFVSKYDLKEKTAVTNEGPKMNMVMTGCKVEIINQMLKREEHHLIEVVKDKQGKLSDVVWCPVYLRPDAKGKARGGDEIPHHRCKTCDKIGLHLLNDGQKYRPCLRCAGWSEAEIPAWYYHTTCCHCEQF